MRGPRPLTPGGLQEIEAHCEANSANWLGDASVVVTSGTAKALIAEVRRLRGMLERLMNQPGVTTEMIAASGIEYVRNPGPRRVARA